MMGVLLKAQSSLPPSLWTMCGVHGPTNDYVNVVGMHVFDRFRKGFFCGCKWCPGPAGGLETRFKSVSFGTSSARSITSGWRNSFDAIVWDSDGTLTGVSSC